MMMILSLPFSHDLFVYLSWLFDDFNQLMLLYSQPSNSTDAIISNPLKSKSADLYAFY